MASPQQLLHPTSEKWYDARTATGAGDTNVSGRIALNARNVAGSAFRQALQPQRRRFDRRNVSALAVHPPRNSLRGRADEARVVAAAAEIGFVNRDPDPMPVEDQGIEIRQTLGPVVMLTMRVPVRVARQFKQFCKANRYSYWEAIEELMKRAEK